MKANFRIRINGFIIGVLLMLFSSCDRTDKADPPRFRCRTSDVLYVDSVRYLLDRSPLSEIAGYDRILSDLPYSTSFPSGIGIMGIPEKAYSAVWYISNDSLFLVGLDHSSDRTTPTVGSLSPAAYEAMERLLDAEFIRDDRLGRRITDSIPSPGVIFASWANRNFYRKKARPSMRSDIGQWERSPFEKMTFKDGILLDCRTLESHPFSEKEMKAMDRKLEKINRRLRKEMKERNRGGGSGKGR